MKNVAVIFGGVSPERDVSVITGALTLNSLDKKEFNPIPVYVDGNGRWLSGEELFDIDGYKNLNYKKLKSVVLLTDGVLYEVKGKKLKKIGEVFAVINCMHGGAGENGSLAGYMETCGVPIASPSVLPSAVAMDKSASKIFFKGAKIPCLPSVAVKRKEELPKELPFDFPVIVKPACGGSSIGINVVSDAEGLNPAVSEALKFGEKAVIEPYITDYTEINCAAYRKADGEIVISPCEKPIKKENILSFDDKYSDGTHEFPAKISGKIADKIRGLTARVYEFLEFDGVIRTDFMVINGKVFVNEINAVPGSLAFYLFCDTLKEYSSMLNELISAAVKKYKRKKGYVTRYDSKILSFSGAKGTKRR